MATSLKNLSEFDSAAIPKGDKFSVGIVVSRWNEQITGALYKGAFDALIDAGVKPKNITTLYVPGTFELPLAAQYLAKKDKTDAVITLGCVIQGETRHFDFICDAAANGVMNVSLAHNKPVIFGVLTTNNLEQAQERAGGKHGNKGIEAAVTALQMIALKKHAE
jgi:6,7-dimethyl-8-ribityllumazine synthase